MSELKNRRVKDCSCWRLPSEHIAGILDIHVNVTVRCYLPNSAHTPANFSRLFSDEGRSFSFDSRGTGYGRGEGCGMIVLKPLEQALKDNDTIRAVIVGRYVALANYRKSLPDIETAERLRNPRNLIWYQWHKPRRQNSRNHYAKWRGSR